MSIGNIKTYGQKGSNMPYQLKVLEGLQALFTSLSTFVGNTGTSTGALLSSTGAGTVAVATKSVSIYNAGAAAGTVNVNGGGNVSIPAGVTVNFDAGTASKYPASHFAYNAAGTTFIISYTY